MAVEDPLLATVAFCKYDVPVCRGSHYDSIGAEEHDLDDSGQSSVILPTNLSVQFLTSIVVLAGDTSYRHRPTITSRPWTHGAACARVTQQ